MPLPWRLEASLPGFARISGQQVELVWVSRPIRHGRRDVVAAAFGSCPGTGTATGTGFNGTVWSLPARISSPWLKSRVQAVPQKVTLFERANGFDSVARCGVHEPARLLEVNDRYQRRPSEPIASCSSRYWLALNLVDRRCPRTG